MPAAVRCHLVSCLCDPAHQPGKLLRHPAEGKECSSHLVLRQEIEQPLGIGHHPAGVTIPVVPRDDALKGDDLKVLLHVDREEMHRWHSGSERGHDTGGWSEAGSCSAAWGGGKDRARGGTGMGDRETVKMNEAPAVDRGPQFTN